METLTFPVSNVMKDTYVTAILESLKSGVDTDTVLCGFARTIEARGHERLRLPVLQSVLQVLRAKRPDTRVLVASETDRQKQQTAIEAALSSLGAPATEVTYTIDDTIVGGYIAEHKATRVDASYKSALLKLYRSITTK